MAKLKNSTMKSTMKENMPVAKDTLVALEKVVPQASRALMKIPTLRLAKVARKADMRKNT